MKEGRKEKVRDKGWYIKVCMKEGRKDGREEGRRKGGIKDSRLRYA